MLKLSLKNFLLILLLNYDVSLAMEREEDSPLHTPTIPSLMSSSQNKVNKREEEESKEESQKKKQKQKQQNVPDFTSISNLQNTINVNHPTQRNTAQGIDQDQSREAQQAYKSWNNKRKDGRHTEAIKWLIQASENGHKEAKQKLLSLSFNENLWIPRLIPKFTSPEEKADYEQKERLREEEELRNSPKDTAFTAMLSTARDHIRLLENALLNARKRVIVVSPFIRSAVKNNKIKEAIMKASQRNVDVIIYTDSKDADNAEAHLIQIMQENRKLLFEAGAKISLTNQLHSKNLIVDDTCFASGSFNWLSAITDPSNQHYNFETSLLTIGGPTPTYISRLMETLKHKVVADYKNETADSYMQEAKFAGIGGFSSDESKVAHAITLYKKYKTSPHGTHARNILLNHLSINMKTLPLVLSTFIKEGESLHDRSIREALDSLKVREGCHWELENYLPIIKAIAVYDMQLAEELVEEMINEIEYGEDVNTIAMQLLEFGIRKELIDQVIHEANSSEGAYFSEH